MPESAPKIYRDGDRGRAIGDSLKRIPHLTGGPKYKVS